MADATRNPAVLNKNADSSLLTVLASVLCLDLVRQVAPSFEPMALAGYSVGQWTALYAAGAIDAAALFSVVHHRACLMDACIDGEMPSGMLAVIGVRSSDIERLCAEAASCGELLQMTNDNAPGQCTLGGSESGLQFAEERLAPLRPKRIQRVPVAGAWHSSLLSAAVPRLADLLSEVALCPPSIRVIDNTTGDWLPDEEATRKAALARHVASPVLWQQGIRTIAKSGATCIVEIGYGDLLTKYGFFIDRSLRHVATAPCPRIRG